MNAALPPHVEAASPHVMNTYGRLPIALSHGQGCRVWDVNGKPYLDALGGIAVNTLGHNHPRLVPALQDQIGKIIHSSNYYHVPLQETLAAKLVELSGLENVFFCSTGLEANEAALKLARKFGHDKGIEKPEIVVYEKAFHGRSIATLSATGNPKVQAGFGPLVEGFIRVPLNDIEAIKSATANNPNVVAVFFEAIQGEGGVNPMHDDYMRDIRKLCDERDWLLMIDEVQCGMGRTGKWFAHQWSGIKPDVMPLAKGLGSGVPIGAVVAGPRAANIFKPGNHGTTFGGNPLAMRAGVETIRIMEEDGLLDNAASVGAHLHAALTRELSGLPGVKDIRGRGLMIGIELAVPCGDLLKTAADHGLLLSVTADTVIRMVPSLILTTAEADEIVAILCPLVRQFLQQSATTGKSA
ncbi:aspartate aminotransferase family protein [Polaromonas sp.]|jgi:acetylornithine aminotransferase|uniref:aspartate aminotransferase family protein n=1 Tax=Polaromonas sp. TaxID=1869339 RepID=UPI002D0CA002|nr:aspartate aminotransferase family protein [Polaromonas sp.]HQS33469.1 aspartate aminotransferase family protein [Polaromonas sp.]HQS92678.1 aspartate aminotransferase family protein [Polaromonas sp.]